MTAPQGRPTMSDALGDALKRIRILEALFPTGDSGSLIVADGSTTVDPVSEIDFTSGAVVTDLGGGVAGVAVTGSGSGAKLYDYTVTGSDKASIDTAIDGSTVANFAGYDVLEIWMIIRTDDGPTQANVDVTLNNDTSSIYDIQKHYGTGSTAAAVAAVAQAKWAPDVHGSGGSAGYPGVLRFSFPGYTGTTFWKVGEGTSGSTPDATSGNQLVIGYTLGYRSTSAITRMKVAAQGAAKLKVGSRLLVYGR